MRRKIFFAAITVFMLLFICAFAACGDDGVQPGTVDSLPDFDGEKTDMSVSQVKDVLTDMISAGGAIPGILQGGSGTVSKEEALAQLDEALEMFENVTAFKAAAVSDEVYENYKKKCEESGLRYAGEYNVDGVLYTSYMGRNSMAFVIRSGTDMTAAIFVMPEEEIIEYDMPSAEVWDRYGLGGMTQPEGSRITFVAESSVDKTFDIIFEFDNTTKKVYDDAVAFCRSKGFTVEQRSEDLTDENGTRYVWNAYRVVDEQLFYCYVDYGTITAMGMNGSSRTFYSLQLTVGNQTAANARASLVSLYDSATFGVKYTQTRYDLYEDDYGNKHEGVVTYNGYEHISYGAAGAASFAGESAEYELTPDFSARLYDRNARKLYDVNSMKKTESELRPTEVFSDFTTSYLDGGQYDYEMSRNRVMTGEKKTIAGFECEKVTADIYVMGDDDEYIVWNAEFWINADTGLVLGYSGRDAWDDPTSHLEYELAYVNEGESFVEELLALPNTGELLSEMPVDDMKREWGLDELPFCEIPGAEGYYTLYTQGSDGEPEIRFYVYGLTDTEYDEFMESLLQSSGWESDGWMGLVYTDGGMTSPEYTRYRLQITEEDPLEDRTDGRLISVSAEEGSLLPVAFADRAVTLSFAAPDLFGDMREYTWYFSPTLIYRAYSNGSDWHLEERWQRGDDGMLTFVDPVGTAMGEPRTPAEVFGGYYELERLRPSYWDLWEDWGGEPLWTFDGSVTVAGYDADRYVSNDGLTTLAYSAELGMILELNGETESFLVEFVGDYDEGMPEGRPVLGDGSMMIYGEETAIGFIGYDGEKYDEYRDENFDRICYGYGTASLEDVETYMSQLRNFVNSNRILHDEKWSWNETLEDGSSVTLYAGEFMGAVDPYWVVMVKYSQKGESGLCDVQIAEIKMKVDLHDMFGGGGEVTVDTYDFYSVYGDGTYGVSVLECGWDEEPSEEVKNVDNITVDGNYVYKYGSLWEVGEDKVTYYEGFKQIGSAATYDSVKGLPAQDISAVLAQAMPARLSEDITKTLTPEGQDEIDGVTYTRYYAWFVYRNWMHKVLVWLDDNGLPVKVDGPAYYNSFGFDDPGRAVVTLSHTDEGSVTPPADAVDEGKLLPSTQWKDSYIAFDVIPSPSGFDDFIAFFDNESTVRLVFLSGEEDSIQWQPGDGLELQYGSNYVADVGGAKVYVYMGTGSGYGYYDNETGQYVTDPRYYMSFHISVER